MILRTFCKGVMEDQSIRGPSIPHIWNKEVVLTLALAFDVYWMLMSYPAEYVERRIVGSSCGDHRRYGSPKTINC